MEICQCAEDEQKPFVRVPDEVFPRCFGCLNPVVKKEDETLRNERVVALGAALAARSLIETAEASAHSAGKVSHLEKRARKHAPLSHEVCDLFLEVFSTFDCKGDCAWAVREIRDLATYWVRCLLLLAVI